MANTYTETLPSGISFDMIRVVGGSFLMGGSDEEAYSDEKPVHEVRLQGFWIAKYSVTQAVWQSVMGKNPSGFTGEDRPVENVSWNDTQRFLEKLKEITDRSYRLPTEAEWEYAARGGSKSEGYLYAGSDRLEQVGWYENNSDGQTHPVGQKLGNELGLYDMSGNVDEWVEDTWHDSYEGGPTDGTAWADHESGARRVRRGGIWLLSARDCRVSFRYHGRPGHRGDDLGFRLALSL